MPDAKTDLRVINVVEPALCMKCRSASIAEVLFTDGSTRRMFYCARLDCDNWFSQDRREYERRAA